ncbi:uncharacterized protein TRIVIDRAFT_70098 [Trichoderma virens Gv29-8]|uniref:Ubiquitin-like domain-containing protein n=1 Tax=Hypocrea virens (strain Gv29-8 / FGSC 10586) TaxID=413071 RepID=G9NDT7_HYPVG|nr:uncharacterized protein TRIVIDRAFT_70098 [Trichoderma virens Gv29-8]EHK15187.1 hypothetical protein TRIVIDRAFT_70098 [Trichoderma virens Gv29-8]UKZ58024.1 hypothetical protein TrVGV298_011885 [Trichoderma virens]
MASELFNQAALGADPASSDQPVVNLQVVSPSVGVNRPLLFPGLVATTTIKQLKEKIRLALPLRPSDENQRLIYRGRALLRDTDNLLDVFGAEALRSPDQQTIHLVIRDASDSVSSTPSFLSGTQSPAPGNQPPNLQRQTPPHAAFMGPPPPPGMTRRSVLQPTPNPALSQPRMPSPARSHSPAHTPEQAAAFQQQHQSMTQWLTQIQREAMARMANQNQRGRANLGVRSVGETVAANLGYNLEPNSGRASPAPTHTIYRETIGPNGHSYHVETVVRNAAGGPSAASTPTHGALTPTEVHGILRGADANQTPMSMANALHQSGLRRSASSASLHNRPLTQPGITTSVFVNSGSRASSGRATPDLGLRSISGTFNPASMSAPSLVPPQSRQGVEVYILSSPEGPRALVFNSAVAEAYYTPRMYLPSSNHQLRNRTSFPSLIHTMQTQSRDDTIHQTSRVDTRPPAQNHQAPAPQPQQQPPRQQQQQQQQQDDQQPRIVPLHAGNPPAGLPNLLVQAAPHIWLMIRLALFVWFFMSPNASWSRWLTIIALAFFVFILSTGLLAGVAEQVWRPLGRHLENVFPAVDPAQARQGGAAGRDDAPGADQNGSPNPAQVAARLVAERRGQESWLVGQLRRLERAGLLFLASIAPGVAERHIANLEAEARAQEARRREAEAAAAAAAAAAEAAAAESSANHGNEDAPETNGGETSQQQPGEKDGQDSRENMEREKVIREEISAL